MELKIGADPETFLSLGGKFISAADILPGTKADPFKVEKGAVQVDGLAFEYNIDPATTREEFDRNHTVVIAQMEEMVKKIDKDIKLNFIPFAEFDKTYFDTLPDRCKVLGCDPDYRSIDGLVKPPPEDLTHMPVRTAAGHIHVGWAKNEDPYSSSHFEDCRFVAHHFSIRNEGRIYGKAYHNKTNEEIKRLKYYCSQGAFRPKSYGVELRQYSNIWAAKPETRRMMFDYIKTSVTQLYRG